MKITQIATVIGVSVLLASGGPALAQTSGTTGNTGTNSTIANDERYENDDTDYGWLGLLGLSGLAGLFKKPERHVVHQTDTARGDYPNR